MSNEFEILQKELDNSFYTLECIAECSFIQNTISSFDEYTTEAEGSSVKERFNSLAERIKAVFHKVIEGIKSAFEKIQKMVSFKIQEEKIASLTKKLNVIKLACAKDKDFENEVSDELKKYEWYDTKELCKDIKPYYTTIGDKVQAKIKTLFNKVKGGKEVTAQDIAELKAMSSRSMVKPLKKYKVLGGISGILTHASEITLFATHFMKSYAKGVGGTFTTSKMAEDLMTGTAAFVVAVSGYAASHVFDTMDTRARKKIEKNRAILADKRVAAAEMGTSDLYGSANELSSLAARCTSALAAAEAQGNRQQMQALSESLGQISSICSALYPKAKTINKSDSDE